MLHDSDTLYVLRNQKTQQYAKLFRKHLPYTKLFERITTEVGTRCILLLSVGLHFDPRQTWTAKIYKHLKLNYRVSAFSKMAIVQK